MQRINETAFLFLFVVLVSPMIAGCQEKAPDIRTDVRVEQPEEVIAPITPDLKVVTGEPATTVEEETVSEEGQTADKKTGAVALKTEY